ncbi:MAG: hypothetical protein KGL39_47680 [Patescibacteria group bacterium]|nr:hypothetical protein [Patescibacteria group bacterium]
MSFTRESVERVTMGEREGLQILTKRAGAQWIATVTAKVSGGGSGVSPEDALSEACERLLSSLVPLGES